MRRLSQITPAAEMQGYSFLCKQRSIRLQPALRLCNLKRCPLKFIITIFVCHSSIHSFCFIRWFAAHKANYALF